MFFLERKGPTSTNPVPMTKERCKEKKTEEHQAVNKTVVTTATSTSQGSNQRTLREVQRDVKTDNSSKTPSKDILAQGEVKLMSNCPYTWIRHYSKCFLERGKNQSTLHCGK